MSDVPGSHSGQCKAIDFRIRHTGMFPHIPSGRYVPTPFQGCYNGITTMGAGALGNADWILLYGTNNSRNPAPKNMKLYLSFQRIVKKPLYAITAPFEMCTFFYNVIAISIPTSSTKNSVREYTILSESLVSKTPASAIYRIVTLQQARFYTTISSIKTLGQPASLILCLLRSISGNLNAIYFDL